MAMGIRAGGIDEGADGVTNFYPAKIWALGSTWSQNRPGLKLFNGIRVALPGALSPYLALALGLVLGFS
jgi:hypothetical protein